LTSSAGHAWCSPRASRQSRRPLFHYARWSENRWEVHELARAGGYLYTGEEDYTGLAAIDPDDPQTVFISTKIDPSDGESLSRYEIFRGVTRDTGASWTWTAMTADRLPTTSDRSCRAGAARTASCSGSVAPT
jgi:hypothetical protein